MVCQYSRYGYVSSEKHAPAPEVGAEEGGAMRRGDHRRAGAREAGEPVDSGCLKGFREGHGGQNGNSALY
jgi:hypothetical protein